MLLSSLSFATAAQAAPRWSSQFQLSTGDGDLLGQTGVTDDAGRATVIWNEGGQLRSRTRLPGGQFGPAADVSPTGEFVYEFDADTDGAGDVTVAWAGDAGEVRTSTRSPQQSDWPAPETLATGSPNTISVDSNPAGVTAVAWIDADAQVHAARRASGATHFDSLGPVSAASGQVSAPDVAVRSDGQVTVVWLQDTQGNRLLFANSTAANTFGSTPQILSDPGSGSLFADEPSLRANGTGDVLAFWDQSDGNESSVWSASLGNASFDDSFNLGGGPTSFRASPALDDAGSVTVAWFENGFPGQSIYAETGSAGSDNYGPPQTVSDGGGYGFMSVAKDSDGQTLVAFLAPSIDLAQGGDMKVSRLIDSVYTRPEVVGFVSNTGCQCDMRFPLVFDHQGGAALAWRTRNDNNQAFLDASILGDPDVVAAAAMPGGEALPEVISARLSSLRFRASASGASIATANAPKGTRLTVNTNKAGTLDIDLQEYTTGRRPSRSSKCSASAKKGKGCTIWKTIDSNTKPGQAGLNTFKVSGRADGKKLKPGQYRVVVALESGNRTSAPKTRTFKIVK